MYTPAFRITPLRPVFSGALAIVFAALCLVAPACGGKGDSPNGASGAAGATGAAAGTSASGSDSVAGGDPVGGRDPVGGAVAIGGGTSGAAGGVAAAGTAGSAGASGGAVSFAGGPAVEGSPTRPQLSATTADDFAVLKYFENGSTVDAPIKDDWDPTAGVGDVTALTPQFTVAASGGSDTTIQGAIDKAVAMGGSERIAIEVADGEYREVVCVPSGGPPITLYSKNPDASATRIVFDNYAGKAKDANTPANPCNPALTATTYGTSGSPTFAAFANGFQAKNITFENDLDETGLSGSVQAVALMTQGDKQVYENVRLLGNQDTFFVKSGATSVIARVYVTKSFIQGDTDFIFGRGVLVIDSSEIHFVSSRQGSKGYCLAPSTDARNPYGILVTKSQFTADAATTAGSIYLGRAWDESGKDLTTYAMLAASGVYPNGQALVRESTLGAHVRAADPWSVAATTSRPFSSVNGPMFPANRLYEHMNTGDGAAK